jgi:hypothetical protein
MCCKVIVSLILPNVGVEVFIAPAVSDNDFVIISPSVSYSRIECSY